MAGAAAAAVCRKFRFGRGSAMSEWFYNLLGEEFGPVPAATIHELVQDGTLAETDSIRQVDGADSLTIARFLQQNAATVTTAQTATRAPAEEPCDLFWFQLEGITLGPVSGQSLVRLAEIGRISEDTLIRRDNEFLWEAAAEFHELSIVFMLGRPDQPKPSQPTTSKVPAESESVAEDTESVSDADDDVDAEEQPTKPTRRAPTKPNRKNSASAESVRGQRRSAGKKLGGRRQPSSTATAEEDAVLQEIFAELEQRKASGGAAGAGSVAQERTAPATMQVTEPAVTSASPAPVTAASGFNAGLSDPQRQAAAALAAARAATTAAKTARPRVSGGGFRIPNPFAGLSDMQFDGPTRTLAGVAVVALLWFGWGPVMGLLNNQQGHYISRVEAAIQEIEKLTPTTPPDVYTKQMEQISREFKAYSVVMTAAASQRQSAKTCLAAVNRLVEFAGTSPTNAKLQKKLLDEARKLVQDYKG